MAGTSGDPRARIGISGWDYAGWRGTFYPTGLGRADELAYAAARFATIEINASFYALQRPTTWHAWREAAPPGFVFAVKAPRFITHVKRLHDVAAPVANFFASGVLSLGDRLGPVLWQLPPTLTYDPDRLETFLDLLPAGTGEAVEVGRHHDERMAGRMDLTCPVDRPLRHAIEVRHPSFADDRFTEQLARHRVALVRSDSPGRWPDLDRATTDLAYARLHGATELYAGGYTSAQLRRWAGWVRHQVEAGRDTYVYFDNDARGHAPFDAHALAELIGG